MSANNSASASAKVSANLSFSALIFISLSVLRGVLAFAFGTFSASVLTCASTLALRSVSKLARPSPVVGCQPAGRRFAFTLPIVAPIVCLSFSGVSGSVSISSSVSTSPSLSPIVLSSAYARTLSRVSSSATTSTSLSVSHSASARLSASVSSSSSVNTSPSVSPSV